MQKYFEQVVVFFNNYSFPDLLDSIANISFARLASDWRAIGAAVFVAVVLILLKIFRKNFLIVVIKGLIILYFLFAVVLIKNSDLTQTINVIFLIANLLLFSTGMIVRMLVFS